LYSPLADRNYSGWICGIRSDLAYFAGDMEGAIKWAKESKNRFYKNLAKNYEENRESGRKLLKVPFVRQHHMTCVPATFTSISHYWNYPADHLEIADSICYDGTTDLNQRQWALKNNFLTREFTVTWEISIALLDKDIPFTLSTVEPDSAHMQSVIGYDLLRKTLLVRDPSCEEIREYNAFKWLDGYAAYGPRGMILLPFEKSGLLEEIQLPDSNIYEDYFQLQSSLNLHDRETAITIIEKLEKAFPEHRLTILARKSLSGYDCDIEKRLQDTEKMIGLYPNNIGFKLDLQSDLDFLQKRNERLEFLNRYADSHPLLKLNLAGVLSDDVREQNRSLALLRSCRKPLAYNAQYHSRMADVLWDASRRDEAFEHYRIAACLEKSTEHYASSYFKAARFLNKTGEALDFLRERFQRFGKKSGLPAKTYFEALDAIEKRQEGLKILEEAISLRSDDGNLLCFVAESFALANQIEKAMSFLEQAKDRTRYNEWLQSAAIIAELQAKSADALVLWKEAANINPFNMRALRAVMKLSSEKRDAIEYLRMLAGRYPHHRDLNILLIEHLEDETKGEAVERLQSWITANPDDSWALTKLSELMYKLGRYAEAYTHIEKAREIHPSDPWIHVGLARLHVKQGKIEEAKNSYHQAIAISVDIDVAITEYVELGVGIAEQRDMIEFVRRELIQQVTFGDGILTYSELAGKILDPHELIKTLEDAYNKRPDLWHSWVALARQKIVMNRLDEAIDLLGSAAIRFPLLPVIFLELSEAYRHLGDVVAQKENLVHALSLNPSWELPARRLADIQQEQGDLDSAVKTVEKSLRYLPDSFTLHGWLADLLWDLNKREDSLLHLEKALHHNTSYLWAWRKLCDRASEINEGERPKKLARLLSEERPNDPYSLLLLALSVRDSAEECEAAFNRALNIAPNLIKAVELYFEWLLENGEYRKAIHLLEDAEWKQNVVELQMLKAKAVRMMSGIESGTLLLEELLHNHPNYTEGWDLLSDWYAEADRFEDYLTAAQQIKRLSPNDPYSWGQVAEGLIKTGKKKEAKNYLEKALLLLPSYSWASRNLLELELQDREWGIAEKLLDHIKLYSPPEEYYTSSAKFHVAKKQESLALAEFEALCKNETEYGILNSVCSQLNDAGLKKGITRILSSLIHEGSASDAATLLWSEQIFSDKPDRANLNRLELYLKDGKGFLSHTYLAYLGKNRRRSELKNILSRFNREFSSDSETWGMVGYALTECGLYAQVEDWMQDWELREETAGWMLLNLAISLRARSNSLKAHRVSEYALSLASDHTTDAHRVLLATDFLMRENYGALSEIVGKIRAESLQIYYGFLYRLADAYVIAGKSLPLKEKRDLSRKKIRGAREFYRKYYSNPYLIRVLKRTNWLVSKSLYGDQYLRRILFILTL
jgi:tetratricopeptide (TPR) repeat protein